MTERNSILASRRIKGSLAVDPGGNAQTNGLKNRIVELETLLAALTNHSTPLKNRITELEETLAEVPMLNRRLAEIEGELDTTRIMLERERLTPATARLAQGEERVKTVEATNRDLEQKLNKATTDLDAARVRADGLVRESTEARVAAATWRAKAEAAEKEVGDIKAIAKEKQVQLQASGWEVTIQRDGAGVARGLELKRKG